MPTVNGQQFPYTPEGIAEAEQARMGAGRGPDLPPMGGQQQMPPIEAVVARIQELQAELQQLVALAEQMSGPQQGGNPAQAGIDATNASMGGGLLA
jgi:hypothetical protein